MIDRGDETIATSQDIDNLSLAFQIKYNEHEIILGGDGSHARWVCHKATLARGGQSLTKKIAQVAIAWQSRPEYRVSGKLGHRKF